MAPPAPRNATARRSELSRVPGLDESTRRALLALCELAAEIANAPASAIIVAGDGAPHFVASVSPDVSLSDCEALLGTYLVSEPEPHMPSDASADREIGDDRCARAVPNIRCSAGLRLETAPGIRIGTLCILDDRPGNLPGSTVTLLQHVATAVSGVLAAQQAPSGPSDSALPLSAHPEAADAVAVRAGKPPVRETRTQIIRRAIGSGEFVPFYQPNVELKWGRIVGFEVLARWQHPTRGLLSPQEFRQAIHDRSITPLLTCAILNAALKDSASWRSDGLSPGSLAINVSSGDLMSKSFATELIRTLDRYGFAPGDLVIEVTEGIAMGEPEGQIHKTLSSLRGCGVRVVLDDFGTGFAGLQHLRNWPIDGLKLDQGFVRNCLTNKEDQIIIRSIVQMCRDLELEVVAEGIEDNAQYLFLSNVGCDLGQGFYFSKPVPAIDVPTLLRGAPTCAGGNAAKAVKIR